MNKISLALLALFVPVILLGCNDSDINKDPPPVPVDEYIGVWQETGYGQYLDIGEEQVIRYEASNDSCIKTHTFSREESLSKLNLTVTSIDENKFSAYKGTNSNAPITMDKATALPASCDTPLINTPTNIINHLISMADAYYSFFETRNIDWAAVSAQAKNAVTDDMSDQELGEVIYQVLSVLEDGHVAVYFNPIDLLAPEIDYDYLEATYQAESLMSKIIAEHEDLQIEQPLEDYYSEQTGIFFGISLGAFDNIKNHNGKIFWGEKNNIGYILVGELAGFDPENAGSSFSEADNPAPHLAALNVVLDEVIEDLQHTNGIILDLRLHTGGTTEFDRAVAKRFIDQDIHYGSFSAPAGESTDLNISPYDGALFTQKTVMITSKYVQSSAEDLVMVLKEDFNTTQVGQATQGMFSDMLWLNLPNQWAFSLSNQVWLDKDGKSWESEGLQPDYEIAPFALSDRQQGIDSTIEKAISLLE